MQIFISHAKRDAAVAARLHDDLKAAGLSPWMAERDIKPGEKQTLAIRRAIRESDYFMPLLSAEALSRRGPVHAQIKLAEEELAQFPENEIFIIPVKLDDCEPVNETLRDLHPADLSADYQVGLNRLLKVFGKPRDIAEAPGAPPPPEHIPLQNMLDRMEGRVIPPTAPGWSVFQKAVAACVIILLLGLGGYMAYRHVYPPALGRHLDAARVYLEKGLYEAAGDSYDQALALRPASPEAGVGREIVDTYINLADGEYDPDRISTTLNTMLDQDPQNAPAHILLGYLHSGPDPEVAAEHFQKALSISPSMAEAHYGLGVLDHRAGKPKEALARFQKAADLSPENSRYLNNLGSAYAELARDDAAMYGKALNAYNKALGIDPDFLLTHLEIADVYRMKGELETALAYQLRLVQEKLTDERLVALPKNQVVWYFLKDGQSVGLFDLPEKKAYAMHTLSVTLFLLGQEGEANQWAQRANALNLPPAVAFEILELARSDLSRFNEKHPESKKQIP